MAVLKSTSTLITTPFEFLKSENGLRFAEEKQVGEQRIPEKRYFANLKIADRFVLMRSVGGDAVG